MKTLNVFAPVRILVGVAAAAGFAVLFASCGQRVEAPSEKAGDDSRSPAPPAVVVPQAPAPIVTQGVASVQPSVSSGVVESAAASVSNDIERLRDDIVQIACLRGSVAGRLDELRKNALSSGSPEVRSMSADVRDARDAVAKKIDELPEVVTMKRVLRDNESRRKELLTQRGAIRERIGKPGSDDPGGTNAVEQLKVVDGNLRALQKEFETALAEHRKIVQRAKEKSPEINALAQELERKELALIDMVNELPDIKALRNEQVRLESRLRDLKTRLRLLENSQAAAKIPPAAASNASTALPK